MRILTIDHRLRRMDVDDDGTHTYMLLMMILYLDVLTSAHASVIGHDFMVHSMMLRTYYTTYDEVDTRKSRGSDAKNDTIRRYVVVVSLAFHLSSNKILRNSYNRLVKKLTLFFSKILSKHILESVEYWTRERLCVKNIRRTCSPGLHQIWKRLKKQKLFEERSRSGDYLCGDGYILSIHSSVRLDKKRERANNADDHAFQMHPS